MAVSEYRQTVSWAETIALARSISRVIETLPNNEEYGLLAQLQHSVVDLPMAVGKDLQRGTTDRLDQLIRLYAIINVIETIYPALDLAKAQADLDKLHDRLIGPNFEELVALPAPPAEEVPIEVPISASADVALSADPTLDPNITLQEPIPTDSPAAPASVPVQPVTESAAG